MLAILIGVFLLVVLVSKRDAAIQAVVDFADERRDPETDRRFRDLRKMSHWFDRDRAKRAKDFHAEFQRLVYLDALTGEHDNDHRFQAQTAREAMLAEVYQIGFGLPNDTDLENEYLQIVEFLKESTRRRMYEVYGNQF